jgi:hypothetical protein
MNEEWVFTVNSVTGEVVKIERLEPTTGDRLELSEQEYAAVAGRDFTAHRSEAEAAAESSQGNGNDAYERGYRQAAADYEAALLGLQRGVPRFR